MDKLWPIFLRIEPTKFKPLPIRINVLIIGSKFVNKLFMWMLKDAIEPLYDISNDSFNMYHIIRRIYCTNQTRKDVRPDKNAAGNSNTA